MSNDDSSLVEESNIKTPQGLGFEYVINCIISKHFICYTVIQGLKLSFTVLF